MEPIDLETVRSRLKELSEMRIGLLGPSEASISDSKKSLEDCMRDFQEKVRQMELEDQNVASLGLEDLEELKEQLKKELHFAEGENLKISCEVGALTGAVAADMVHVDGDLEALSCSLKFMDSKGLEGFQSNFPDGRLISENTHGSPIHMFEDYKFEILELGQQIETKKINLGTLQDLDYSLKRFDAIEQLEYILSEVKVIEFEGNCLKLSLRTPIPMSGSLLPRQKLDTIIEPSVSDHELLIEVIDGTAELKRAEIFPEDVFIDGIIETTKSTRDFIFLNISSLGWFVRQVQHRILLCDLRRLLVRDANKSRHSFEYSDRDETITVHLVGGIDAFIKMPQDWPVSSSALKLISIKNSDIHSKSISLAFLCKVKELANSLDMQTRNHLARFVDAVEDILVLEMRSELYSNNNSA